MGAHPRWEWFALLAGLGLVILRRRAGTKRLPLPPSPPPHLLLGNLKDLPKEREWLGYAKISQDCQSDIISLSVLGQTIIVLSSHRAVSDLLDKRAIYADRPWIPMIHDDDLMDLGGIVTFTSYGPRWRQLRKSIHMDMQESVIPKYWPSLQAEARRLVARLSEHGDDKLLQDVQHWAAAFLLSGTYGYHLPNDTSNDPLLRHMEELLDLVTSGVQSSKFLVNVLPLLKYWPEWMPGGSFQAFARRARELKKLAADDPFNRVKAEMATGTAQPSFVSRMLSEIDSKAKEDLDSSQYEDLVLHNAATMFGAGFDTTVATLLSFFVVMQLHPEVQSRAREEVLRVLDPATGLPNPADVVKLPYLQNVLREVLRWLPALPLGIPHMVMEDDEYKGYRIPARSVVIANHWAISRDESVYSAPETFNPDRFLDPNVPHETPFGFGRRRCPGMHLANSNLLIVFAYILTAFEITKATNEDGSVVEPSATLRSDLISRSQELRCGLRPRNPKLLAELCDE